MSYGLLSVKKFLRLMILYLVPVWQRESKLYSAAEVRDAEYQRSAEIAACTKLCVLPEFDQRQYTRVSIGELL